MQVGNGEGASIGFVPQRFSLAGEMKVLDTIAYAAWINGVPRKECEAAAARSLRQVRMGELTDRRIRSISGGQRQRVGIAAALAHEPSVVVLDEPTVGLDPGQRLRIREVIADIGHRYTVVLSTHLLEDISYLCKYVGVLAGGRLVFDGAVDELTAKVANSESGGILGSDFERAYDALITNLDGQE